MRFDPVTPPFDSLRSRGLKVCRWCGGMLKGRRTSWCSDECHYQYELHSNWELVKNVIRKRDNGICAICGMDTEWLFEIFGRCGLWKSDKDDPGANQIVKQIKNQDPWLYKFIETYRRGRNSRSVMYTRVLHDIDHIIPICEGGDGWDLDNLRTLCVYCHCEETKKLMKRRAA